MGARGRGAVRARRVARARVEADRATAPGAPRAGRLELSAAARCRYSDPDLVGPLGGAGTRVPATTARAPSRGARRTLERWRGDRGNARDVCYDARDLGRKSLRGGARRPRAEPLDVGHRTRHTHGPPDPDRAVACRN